MQFLGHFTIFETFCDLKDQFEFFESYVYTLWITQGVQKRDLKGLLGLFVTLTTT